MAENSKLVFGDADMIAKLRQEERYNALKADMDAIFMKYETMHPYHVGAIMFLAADAFYVDGDVNDIHKWKEGAAGD